jgi:hypothetical protein
MTNYTTLCAGHFQHSTTNVNLRACSAITVEPSLTADGAAWDSIPFAARNARLDAREFSDGHSINTAKS